jgi:hypothetical protein
MKTDLYRWCHTKVEQLSSLEFIYKLIDLAK